MINFDTIKTAAEQLFRQFGIRSVSMSDIAKVLGVSKKTLYLHIDNKNDLIQKIMITHIQDQQNFCITSKAKAKDALEEMLLLGKFIQEEVKDMNPTLIYDLQKYHHDVWALLQQFHNVDILKIIQENLQRGIEEGLYRSNLHTIIVSKLYVNLINTVTELSSSKTQEFSIPKLQQEFMTYHLHAILSAEGHIQLDKYLSKPNNQ